MKGLLLFLGLTIAGVSAFEPALKVKFNVGLGVGTDFFYDIPTSIGRAIMEKWTKVENRPEGSPRSSLVTYCYSDKKFCGLYDFDVGMIAGLIVSIPQDEITDTIFDWKVQGFSEWKPIGDNKKYWSIQQYFVSEEYLQLKPAERLEQYDSTKTLQGGIWLTGFNGLVDKVPADTEGVENSIFTKQACIPWMGRHYYYNMTESTPCQADTMYPWFPLVHSGEVVATGLVIFGKLPIKSNERDWFERPPTLAVQAIVPRGPQCLYNLAANPGLITMHIYYISNPWILGCLLN